MKYLVTERVYFREKKKTYFIIAAEMMEYHSTKTKREKKTIPKIKLHTHRETRAMVISLHIMIYE